VLGAIPTGAPIVAADRGAAHAQRLGLTVSIVVGDLDSLDGETLRRLAAAGAVIERHPATKGASDLALALDHAAQMQPRRILVVGATSGRFDQALAQVLLLAADAYAPFELDALLGRARVHVVRGARRLGGSARELVSLLAVNGAARGVTSEGLVYPLRGETLAAGSTRGLSNLFEAESAGVEVEQGVLLAVVPGGLVSRRVYEEARRSVRAGSGSS